MIVSALPVIILICQVIFFCVAIGQPPSGLKLGVVNNELFDPGLCEISNYSELEYCDLNLFSCKMFKTNHTVTLINYDNQTEAEQDVEAGVTWGYLAIPANFTESLIAKVKVFVLVIVIDQSNPSSLVE